MKALDERLSEAVQGDLLKAGRRRCVCAALVFLLTLSFWSVVSLAQQTDTKSTPNNSSTTATATPNPTSRTYPKEIRGYKVERARVEIKKPKDSHNNRSNDDNPSAADADALIQFGQPRVVKTTPLGITLEVPVTVAAVKQGGRVDFLTFEEMVVNGTPVTVEDYMHSFNLPNKSAVDLPEPVRLFVRLDRALLGALGEWTDAKEVWPVTGRVYVFGSFKKFLFKFKRVVPVELSATLPNPLKKKENVTDTSPAIKQ
jgi:hypothetical protein